ncbi:MULTISPECIES: hypothetical protein [unclassified Crossiella]|uniref:hypothetical protein n=1 Tax=unclassified Crossiella TaxID=2620835 RepID=UPI0020000899|nr:MULTISPECIES: hypothetical protein [unclassified Crossiella]MCK2236398.1 hypothetical protein [Crossiella sp. S99.2]MCK2250065.1 hypothetical protein [Crossiella sp. S99.1]
MVDPLLAELDGARLLVRGSDADLAAVVLRVLRQDRLGEVTLGYLPTDPGSRIARLWGLPTELGAAWRVALGAGPVGVPLLRDDVGGVLLGHGEISPVKGSAYCDDVHVLKGAATRLAVGPDPAGGEGLLVRVRRRGLFGRRTIVQPGRALQLACEPATVLRDGVPHARLMEKWTWYRHTADLRLVRAG